MDISTYCLYFHLLIKICLHEPPTISSLFVIYNITTPSLSRSHSPLTRHTSFSPSYPPIKLHQALSILLLTNTPLEPPPPPFPSTFPLSSQAAKTPIYTILLYSIYIIHPSNNTIQPFQPKSHPDTETPKPEHKKNSSSTISSPVCFWLNVAKTCLQFQFQF